MSRAFQPTVTFLGRLGAHPMLEKTKAGKEYYRYRIAVSRYLKKDEEGNVVIKDNKYPEYATNWFTIFSFSERQHDRVRLCGKGTKVLVEAEINQVSPKAEGSGTTKDSVIFKQLGLDIIDKPRTEI